MHLYAFTIDNQIILPLNKYWITLYTHLKKENEKTFRPWRVILLIRDYAGKEIRTFVNSKVGKKLNGS